MSTYAAAKKSTDPKPYIAAVFTSSETPMTKFILGDGKNTNAPTSRRRRSTADSYHNGPLEPGTRYRIFQRIFLKGGYNYSTDWSSALKTYLPTEAKGSSDESSTGMIVGVVIALLLLLVVFTLLAVVLYRRRKSSNTQSGDKNNELLPEEQISSKYNTVTVFEIHDNQTQDDEPNDYPLQNNSHPDENVDTTDLPKKEESLYGNQETIIARSHFPIPVSEFDGYVSRMKRNDKKEFKLDFEDLPTGQKLNWSIAKLSFNIPKNRFGNAVTYNDSRVVLSGNEKSDYINASHINGIEKKYYIATQGPKPKTVNDFWRMIFEYKCPTIVMLTTLKEMGKVKCEKYWPDESEVYGEIKVTATRSRAFADYITRTFIVEKGEDKLEVKQFHFRSWPDYGVPLYPTQILTFRRDYKSYHETTSGPAVIHCSAGVGRTGVFIAVDKILDDLDKEKKDVIDVFGFVKDMRTRRVNMVQTAEQYVFIHDTILDHIKCGTNEVEATQLMIVIKKLSEINEKGQSGFEQKFQQLNNISPKLEKELCEAALLPENKAKNRNAEISPTESVRVCLKRLEDIENSDYINACHVDGYLGKNYFIATQTPLQRTKSDFWRMVFQHNSSTIVVLNQLRENDKDYPMFWPTERAKPQSFGTITVMLDSFVTNGNIVVRKLLVSPSSNLKDGRIVRLVQYMSWPDHGVPENVNDIVKLLSEVEDAKRAAEKKGPIIVVCSDGAGRSGTYIAISNLVDRVKVVQVIDVFQCIKLIRAKRPQFVETAAQFKLCYEAITSVLESFNEYSNFSG
ncbi:receptor-type tyrosine-protein phosphatase S-like [Dendronephthya gigantea]|uniref:receptor-type tyrosine-protein phosphatase S-like n=1 Tax=Dendronephthya gigantea TaxID=151771 RepID=UPI001069D56B|nr:receptor-type tyrosine-protein phosphatase S-like [Dendronephthya gigantea]